MRFPKATAVALAGLVVLGGPGVPGATEGFPDAASRRSAQDGAAYLATTQGDDGSVPADTGDEPRPDETAETLLALVAGGAPDQVIDDALGYIADTADEFLHPDEGEANAGRLGRVVSALVATGANPRAFAGVDWVEEIESYYVPGTGTYGSSNFYADLLAMLGILAAGADLPLGAVERVRLNQCHHPTKPAVDGGWGHTACGKPDTDTTALALSVLAVTRGIDAPEVGDARAWLVNNQWPGGCWGHDSASKSENANSCGLALSAVLRLGEDPRDAPWADGEADPAARLRQFQLPSGGFRVRLGIGSEDPHATRQAVPGLAGWKYPVSAPVPPETGGPGGPGNGANSGNGGNAGGGSGDNGSGGGASSKAPASTGATSSTGAGDPGSQSGDRDRRHDRGDPTSTSSTVVPRVLGRKVAPLAWPVLGAGGDGAGAGAYDRERGRPPDLVARETGGEGPGVARAGLVATGALGSVGFGTGAVWRRRRMAGLL